MMSHQDYWDEKNESECFVVFFFYFTIDAWMMLTNDIFFFTFCWVSWIIENRPGLVRTKPSHVNSDWNLEGRKEKWADLTELSFIQFGLGSCLNLTQIGPFLCHITIDVVFSKNYRQKYQLKRNLHCWKKKATSNEEWKLPLGICKNRLLENRCY